MWDKSKAREAHLILLGMQESLKKWTLTLPSELPLQELKSQWTIESSRSNCRGQNPLNWIFLYIIAKLLKRRCFKWAYMTHLDIWNTSYGQKKGWESNWHFDSQPLKVKNRLNSLVWRCCATYRWKDIDQGYNFASNLISIRGLHTKLWAPKVARDPTLGIPRQNVIWMWASWRGTKYTISGKVVTSPKSRLW
jgi:hypothetical protein